MRDVADASKVDAFMRGLARRACGPGRVYLTGGASAVLIGWRTSTIDIDIKLDPEPPGAFEAIARLKEELAVNVELAAPDNFIPVPESWRDTSTFVARHGEIDYFHYEFVSQALSKIERGHAQDVADVKQMLSRGLVTRAQLVERFQSMSALLVRYPAIDPTSFASKVDAMVDAP